jgi:hypothetical protein
MSGMDTTTSGGTAMGSAGSTGGSMSTSGNMDSNALGDDEDNTARSG